MCLAKHRCIMPLQSKGNIGNVVRSNKLALLSFRLSSGNRVRVSKLVFSSHGCRSRGNGRGAHVASQILQDRLLDRRGERLSIDKVDLGAKFTHELNSFANAKSSEATAKADEIRQRCANMLAEALNQVEKGLPKSAAIFKGLSSFTPSKILSQTSRVAFKDLPMPHL